MEPIRKHRGVVAPLHRENIDTDQIIPKQHLEAHRAHRLRRNSCFSTGATIPMAATAKTSCSTTSTTATRPSWWRARISAAALRASTPPGRWANSASASFSRHRSPTSSATTPATMVCWSSNLPEPVIQRIAEHADKHRPYHLNVDLENQTITDDFGFSETFEIDAFRRHRLLHGLDEIGMTLEHTKLTSARFEQNSTPVCVRARLQSCRKAPEMQWASAPAATAR